MRAVIAKLVAGAPDGPWTQRETRVHFANGAGGFDVRNCPSPLALAAFVAASREAVPALLAEVADKESCFLELRRHMEAEGCQYHEDEFGAPYAVNYRASTAESELASLRAEVEEDDALFSSVYQALVAAYGKLDADQGHGPALQKICDARFAIEKRTSARAALSQRQPMEPKS